MSKLSNFQHVNVLWKQSEGSINSCSDWWPETNDKWFLYSDHTCRYSINRKCRCFVFLNPRIFLSYIFYTRETFCEQLLMSTIVLCVVLPLCLDAFSWSELLTHMVCWLYYPNWCQFSKKFRVYYLRVVLTDLTKPVKGIERGQFPFQIVWPLLIIHLAVLTILVPYVFSPVPCAVRT
jgi:hypothetical protein